MNRRTLKSEKLLSSSPSRKSAPTHSPKQLKYAKSSSEVGFGPSGQSCLKLAQKYMFLRNTRPVVATRMQNPEPRNFLEKTEEFLTPDPKFVSRSSKITEKLLKLMQTTKCTFGLFEYFSVCFFKSLGSSHVGGVFWFYSRNIGAGSSESL